MAVKIAVLEKPSHPLGWNWVRSFIKWRDMLYMKELRGSYNYARLV